MVSVTFPDNLKVCFYEKQFKANIEQYVKHFMYVCL